MGLKDDLIRKYIHAPKKIRKVTDRVIPGSRKLNNRVKKRAAKGKKTFERTVNKRLGVNVFPKRGKKK